MTIPNKNMEGQQQEEEIAIINVDSVETGNNNGGNDSAEVIATATEVPWHQRQDQKPPNQLLSVTVHKPSAHTMVGLSVKGTYPEIMVTTIKSGTVCAKTDLEPGMLIQTINGRTFQNAKEVGEFLVASVGDLNIVVHRNIIEACIYKPSPETRVGVGFTGDKPPIVISSIKSNSPLQGSAIQTGMVLVRIDGQCFGGSSQVASYLKECQGKVTFEARRKFNYETPTMAVTSGVQPRPPPPGVKAGGRWTGQKYHGSTTCCLMLLGCFVVGVFGLIPLCIPCDDRWVYIVDGRAYDEYGRLLA